MWTSNTGISEVLKTLNSFEIIQIKSQWTQFSNLTYWSIFLFFWIDFVQNIVKNQLNIELYALGKMTDSFC